MDDGTRNPALLDSLSIARLSTSVLLFYVLTLLLVPKSPKPSSSSAEPITVVVVADVQPRRPFILTLLTFAAFTYFLDGLVVFIYYITRGFQQSYFHQWRGVELADVLGFITYAALILIGTYKERHGADFWSRKRIKLFAWLAIAFDVAYLVLLVRAVRIFQKRPSSPGVPERPNVPGIYVPNFLHFLALDARLVALVILLIVLFKPRTTYSTVRRDRPASPTPHTLLLPASSGVSLPQPTAYGTFNEQPSAEITKGHADETAILDYAPPKDSGKHKADGYDLENAPSAAEGSSKHAASSSHEAPAEDQNTSAIGPHTALLERDPEIEDVPNPITDEPEALTTSYAAVAAAAVQEPEEGAKKDGDEDVQKSDSPTAFAFPSATRDDASSIRGSTRGAVTFSDPVGAKSGNGDSTVEIGPDGKKRKRISSQNIKRIVRKIGDLPKRQGSISSLGSRRNKDKDGGDGTPGSVGGDGITPPGQGQTTPKKSREDSRTSAELGYLPPGESPAASIDDSPSGSKKWRRRMSLGIRRSSTAVPAYSTKDDIPVPAANDDVQAKDDVPVNDDAPAKDDAPAYAPTGDQTAPVAVPVRQNDQE